MRSLKLNILLFSVTILILYNFSNVFLVFFIYFVFTELTTNCCLSPPAFVPLTIVAGCTPPVAPVESAAATGTTRYGQRSP